MATINELHTTTDLRREQWSLSIGLYFCERAREEVLFFQELNLNFIIPTRSPTWSFFDGIASDPSLHSLLNITYIVDDVNTSHSQLGRAP